MVQEQPAKLLELLAAGEEALVGGAWERARALFAAALEVEETPEGLEGLGAAAFFLDDAVASLDSRERAFRLYRERDDRRGAARAAISLAIEPQQRVAGGNPRIASQGEGMVMDWAVRMLEQRLVSREPGRRRGPGWRRPPSPRTPRRARWPKAWLARSTQRGGRW
jgi:hypothetical protein